MRRPVQEARGARRLAVFAAALLSPTQAFAHASERGHVLLLPTGYYLAGGALAVAASFLILAFVRPELLRCYGSWRLGLASAPRRGRVLVGALSFAFFALLVAAGFFGSADPLHNPLPTFVWTMMWVGLTLLHGLLGNLWPWLNPWHAPYRLVSGFLGRRPMSLPGQLACWPAVVLLLAFAWFELVDIAPQDPRRLATAVTVYWVVTFAGCLLFGYGAWMRRCEFLGIFFGMISRFSILDVGEGRKITVCLPGARLFRAGPLGASGVVFLLAALGSVSFDGLSRTFAWLAAIGVNPLEFPGRSLVVGPNTAGLLLAVSLLVAAFVLAVRIGERLAGSRNPPAALGLLVWSIVPIALAYHFSHYLTVLLVDGQYALIALSDPFSRGWNLLGLTGRHAGAGITMGHEAAWLIWNAQAAAIVGGHVLAVLLAHMLALRLHPEPRDAMRSQPPLAVLMVAYTLLGLWLLSTPAIG